MHSTKDALTDTSDSLAHAALPTLRFLSDGQTEAIRATAFRVLDEIGCRIENEQVFDLLSATAGVQSDPATGVVRFSRDLVLESVDLAPSSYTIYGRDVSRCVTYGQGRLIFKSTPADPYWADAETLTWRPGTIQDVRQAIDLATALPNVDIVGAMVEPAEKPAPVRAIHSLAELLKRTTKPPRVWAPDRASARYMVELMRAAAGGAEPLRQRPMMHHTLEPISPLRYSTGLEAVFEFAAAGLPIIIGPMPQVMLTGPATLAGTTALCLAENLAGIVIVQRLAPGTPVAPAASAHPCDPKTANIVYGSPEQALLGAAITQVLKSFDLPCYANAGYCDSKVPDAQALLEKSMPLLLAALAGADSFAHLGVAGTMGASLTQLVVDDEMVGYLRRLMRGFAVSAETLAFEAIKRVGIGGEFMSDEHTAKHWRQEFWLPTIMDRQAHDVWLAQGAQTMQDRAKQRMQTLLNDYQPPLLDDTLQHELDKIVAAAEKELL